jgi:hypothetical protein
MYQINSGTKYLSLCRVIHLMHGWLQGKDEEGDPAARPSHYHKALILFNRRDNEAMQLHCYSST